MTPDAQAHFHANYNKYERDVVTEVELLSDLGRLFHDGRRRVGLACFDIQGGLPDDPVEPVDDGQEISREPPPVVDLEDPPDSGGDTVDDSSLETDRLVDCVSQCFDEFCFPATRSTSPSSSPFLIYFSPTRTTETIPPSTSFKRSRLTFFLI